eukprot:7291599-Prymnesium_polylepis.1
MASSLDHTLHHDVLLTLSSCCAAEHMPALAALAATCHEMRNLLHDAVSSELQCAKARLKRKLGCDEASWGAPTSPTRFNCNLQRRSLSADELRVV